MRRNKGCQLELIANIFKQLLLLKTLDCQGTFTQISHLSALIATGIFLGPGVVGWGWGKRIVKRYMRICRN